jgi:hypothetical protein
MICEICGKEFDNYKGLSSHIRQTHYITSKDYYDKYLKTENEGICSVCGKETPFKKLSLGYQKHCCGSCSIKDTETQNKIKTTRLEKYGVENFFQNKSIQQKAEENAHSEEANKKKVETSQKHFGVDNPAQSEVVQNKMQQTNLERYGVDSYMKTPEFRKKSDIARNSEESIQKRKQTYMKHYGVENLGASLEIRNKIEENNLQKYGVKNVSQVKEFREKIENTMLEKYGVKYPLQSDEILSKIKQHNLEIYGTEYPMQNKEIIAKVQETKIKNINEFAKSHNCTPTQQLLKLYGSGWHQAKLGREIEFIYDGISFVKNEDIDKIKQYCSIVHTSNYENELVQIINDNFSDNVLTHSRSIIKPLELDIYIPKLKLAIEFNGIYWHSIEASNTKEYHLMKSLLCRDKGIRLIHIYEFEDFEQQKQLLKNLILGQDNYPKEDFNKNNLITYIPEPTIIYQNNYTIYGAGPLY